MEKKEILPGFSTFRPFSYIGTYFKSFLGKFDNPKRRKINGLLKLVNGFTLVELIVVIMILSVMFSMLLFILNPFKQIEKARDAQRQSDLKQTVQALDTYYNDNNCYPSSVNFGNSWQPYMAKIPQDPDYSSGGASYVYLSDNSSPCTNGTTGGQWNVLFAKLAVSPVSSSTSCPLTQIPNCLPKNWVASGYNFCILSGQVDCNIISNSSITYSNYVPPTSTPIPTSGPTSTSAPTPTPIPTVTPTPVVTPTLVPGGCYCVNAQYDLRPLCNLVGTGAVPPAKYCDFNCTIQCQ